FIFVAVFIHTASLFFIICGILAFLLSKANINNYFKICFFIFIGFCLSIITGPLRYIILSYFEDRRADYIDMDFGFIFSSFWFYLLFSMVLILVRIKDRIRDYQAYSIIFLSLIFLNYFIGGYSSRFIAATYPFVLISLFYLKYPFRIIGIIFYLFYTFVLTYYWIG